MQSKRVSQMDVSGIREVFELAQKMKDPVNMSIGQPNFSVPQNVKDEICMAVQRNHNYYSLTQGIDELRDAIVKKMCVKNNILAEKKNILITSAVSGGLSIAIPCIIDEGDEIVIFDPSFVGYKQLIQLYGGVSVSVKKNEDFSINFEALEKSVTQKTRAIIINTPENPTGYVMARSEVEQLAQWAKKHDIFVLADEIYEDFVYDGEHVSIGAYYDKVITLGGFSKSHAMMGMRVGYVCAPDCIVDELIKVQQYTFVCAPVPMQYGAVVALNTDISENVQEYKKKRDKLYAGIREEYGVVKSDGAFYFFVKYPCESELFLKKCLEHHLLVVPGSVFSEYDTHFRISFSVDDAIIDRAIEILSTIVKEILVDNK